MRDKKRIDRILNKIKRLWLTTPDQRFGQLLINNCIIPDNFVVWLREDDELENALEGLFK